MLNKIKQLFKDFKFTKLENKPGNEMIRTSWYGRHDYVPYIRIDLWRVGFRISYDPDYYAKFRNYVTVLSKKQHEEIMQRVVDQQMAHVPMEGRKHISRNGCVIAEPPMIWRDACHYAEDRGWV